MTFLKSKTPQEKADEEQAKNRFKLAKLQGQNLDKQAIKVRREKMQELKRLTA